MFFFILVLFRSPYVTFGPLYKYESDITPTCRRVNKFISYNVKHLKSLHVKVKLPSDRSVTMDCSCLFVNFKRDWTVRLLMTDLPDFSECLSVQWSAPVHTPTPFICLSGSQCCSLLKSMESCLCCPRLKSLPQPPLSLIAALLLRVLSLLGAHRWSPECCV